MFRIINNQIECRTEAKLSSAKPMSINDLRSREKHQITSTKSQINSKFQFSNDLNGIIYVNLDVFVLQNIVLVIVI